MGKTEVKNEKRMRRKWVWVIGALLAVILAIAATSKSASKISFLGRISDSCQCTDSPKYTGNIVEDCCCDYETIDSINQEVLHPLLQELVTTPFFRYFKRYQLLPLSWRNVYWVGKYNIQTKAGVYFPA